MGLLSCPQQSEVHLGKNGKIEDPTGSGMDEVTCGSLGMKTLHPVVEPDTQSFLTRGGESWFCRLLRALYHDHRVRAHQSPLESDDMFVMTVFSPPMCTTDKHLGDDQILKG